MASEEAWIGISKSGIAEFAGAQASPAAFAGGGWCPFSRVGIGWLRIGLDQKLGPAAYFTMRFVWNLNLVLGHTRDRPAPSKSCQGGYSVDGSSLEMRCPNLAAKAAAGVWPNV